MKAFALNTLYIARDIPNAKPKDVWEAYRAIEEVSFDKFKSMALEAEGLGYLRADYARSSLNHFIRKVETEITRNVNEELQDALILHQVRLLRFSSSLRNDITEILNRAEKGMRSKIETSLRTHKGASSLQSATMKQVEAFIKKVRRDAWNKVSDRWAEELATLAANETTNIEKLLISLLPVTIVFNEVPAGQLRALVTHNPFQGQVLRAWADQVADADIQRILQQIRIGMINGEDSAQIARRVVGTARLKGADGVTQISRRNAAAITRTAVMSISHAARQAFYDANADVFDQERFVATLDSRTTPICRANDSKIFESGKGPQPPLHFGCRSIRIPYFDGEALGTRPAKNTTEEQLLREYLELTGQNGLARGQRSKFRTFSRERINEMTSIVPASTTYAQWLRRQSAAIQDDILGKARGKLFREGKITLDRFVDEKGKLLTLDQLRSML